MKPPANNNTPSEQSSNPIIHQSPRLFVQPAILEQIDPRRLAKFLNGFADDLKAAHPDLLLALNPELSPGPYSPADLAAFFATATALPPRLRQALSTLETAAAPENDLLLDALIQRHIPNVALNRYFPLDCALELWFLAPQSLDCFAGLSVPGSAGACLAEASERRQVPAGQSTDRGTSPARSSLDPTTGTGHPASHESSPVPSTNPGIHESNNPASGSPTTDNRSLTTDEPIENHKSKIKNAEDQDQAALQALAHLSLVDYDRTRKQSARQLGIGVETLDAEVTRIRNQIREDEAFNSALCTLHSPLVWPEPVDGAEVLTQIVERFLYYVIVPPGAPEAFTLWSAHAHCFLAFIQSPRLNICSPEGGCGKTTALPALSASAGASAKPTTFPTSSTFSPWLVQRRTIKP